MMKKLSLGALVLMMSLSAAAAEEMVTHEQEKSGEFYVVVKALYTLGEDIKEEKGKAGGGVGFDIGYTMPHDFAVEWDNSVSTNKVSAATEELTAKFWTTALDLTYTYELTHAVGIMGKVGYEYEYETINKETASDSGFVYGAAIEYHLSEKYEALVEYEGSAIKSLRGASIYAGIKYIF